MEMKIIAVSGTRELSKSFVSRAESLGYEIFKINPIRAKKELTNVLAERGSPAEDKIYGSTDEFLEKTNGYYWYTVRKVNEYLRGYDRNKIAILVNASNELLEFMKDDFGAFSIYLGDRVSQNPRYDYTILANNNFEKNVKKVLGILGKE